MMTRAWYRTAYLRSVVDMHITDWDARFLAAFDPQHYVDKMVTAGVQSTVMYAHSHVGICNYPSQVGPMHRGLKGRNIVQEVLELCHQHDIAVVLYCSLIFDTWAYRNHTDWRIIKADGEGAAERSRYGVCCPNSPYRDYVAALAQEIAATFDCEGIRCDMTFWPRVCYCRHCRARYVAEVGGALPQTIHWQEPGWVGFQRKREEWLVDFATHITDAIKAVKPQITVEHQASTYFSSWRLGVTTPLARQNDFLQGDFYGDAAQGSFARKLFYNLSEKRPAAYETSSGVELRNYLALKSPELLHAKAAAAIADGCAFVFIDSIDPEGTLNDVVYERMGTVFHAMQPYLAYLDGELCQDVAIYLSTESKGDFADNGKAVDDPQAGQQMPHINAAVSVCRALVAHHIPFGVITKRNLADLARHRVVVLPNVMMMDDEEAQAFRRYVEQGGSLYASRYTSLFSKDGRRQDDFLLADVLGVSYRGETEEQFTYLAPTAAGESLLPTYDRRHPMGLDSAQLRVACRSGSQVLGTLTLPYTNPAHPVNFVSIHNNPPGVATEQPALVLNQYGAGKALYVAGDLETPAANQAVWINLLRLLSPVFSLEVDAPAAVEVTLFHQPEQGRFLLNLVNFQKQLPNIPVYDIGCGVRIAGKTPQRVTLLPAAEELRFTTDKDVARFCLPKLETFAMLALEYA